MQPIQIIEKDDSIYTKISGQNISLLKMNSFYRKKVGLLNHSSLPIEFGISYKNTKLFHTFNMQFPISVLCFDKNYHLLSSSCIVNINSIFICPRKTKYTFEMNEEIHLRMKNNLPQKIRVLSKNKSKILFMLLKNTKFILLILFILFFSYSCFANDEMTIPMGRTRVLDLGKAPLSIQISDPDILEIQRIGITNSIKIIPKQEGDSEISLIFSSGENKHWNIHIGNKKQIYKTNSFSQGIKMINSEKKSEIIPILMSKINSISGIKCSFSGEKIILLGEIKNLSNLIQLAKIVSIQPSLFFPTYHIPTDLEESLLTLTQNELKLFGERNLKVLNQQGLFTVIGVPSSPTGKIKAWNYLSGLVPNVVDAMSLQVGDSSLVQINLDFLELGSGKKTEFGFKNSIMSSIGGDLNFPSGLVTKSNLEPSLQIGSISAFFKAIQNSSFAREIAKPVVITRSGEKASFLAGGEVPLVTSTATTASTTSNVTYKPFGILFNVTPRVQVDGSIWIKLDLEVSQISESLSVNGIPGFTSRKVNTHIILNEGTTAILSGLIQNKDVKQVEKIPILGSIPIIGELFKSRNFQENNTELWVAVTALRADREDNQKISEKILEEKFEEGKSKTSSGLLD